MGSSEFEAHYSLWTRRNQQTQAKVWYSSKSELWLAQKRHFNVMTENVKMASGREHRPKNDQNKQDALCFHLVIDREKLVSDTQKFLTDVLRSLMCNVHLIIESDPGRF